jgi:uncharacterized membrane protein YgcG
MRTASFAMTARAMLAAAVAVAIVFVPSIAQAHFTLDYPPEWTVDTDTSGDPQKAFPCGVLSTDTFTMSNMMTTFAPGQTITVQWTEVVAHDGWFRIALSYMNGAELQSTTDFPEPSYATDNTPAPFGPYSLDASIENPPVPPVLMDDIAPHTAASVTVPMQYSQAVTLPNMPCSKCVLQVIQIMLNHPVNQPNNVPGAAYTYHHCAFIAIQPNGDGGTQVIADAGTPLDSGSNSSGGGRPDATVGSTSSSGSGSGSGSGTGGSSGSTGSSSGGATSGGSSGASGSNGAGTSNGGTTSSGSSMSTGGASSAANGAPTTGAGGGSTNSQSGGCTVSPAVRWDVNALAGLGALGFLAAARRRLSVRTRAPRAPRDR